MSGRGRAKEAQPAPRPMRSFSVVQAGPLLTNQNNTSFGYDSLEEAFPSVEPGTRPFGAIGLFQIRHPKKKTKGGIMLDPGSRSTEYYNTQIAKVIALGPLCFKTTVPVSDAEGNAVSQTLIDWPEGRWFDIGSYVRVPKYGGDRFSVSYEVVEEEIDPDTGRPEKKTVKDEIIFVFFKVKDIIGLVDNPLEGKAYLD